MIWRRERVAIGSGFGGRRAARFVLGDDGLQDDVHVVRNRRRPRRSAGSQAFYGVRESAQVVSGGAGPPQPGVGDVGDARGFPATPL
jgi:hypothetical protein